MADSCAELKAEIAQLRAEIARIKPVDVDAIINKAKEIILPLSATAAFGIVVNKTDPINAKIGTFESTMRRMNGAIEGVRATANQGINNADLAKNLATQAKNAAATTELKAVKATTDATNAVKEVGGLKGLVNGFGEQVNRVEKVAGDALIKGAKAIGISEQALLKVGIFAARVLELAAAVATIFTLIEQIGLLETLGARIDAVERNIASVGSDASKALGFIFQLKNQILNLDIQLPGIKDIANKALAGLSRAESQLAGLGEQVATTRGVANNAFQKASSAELVAKEGLTIAKSASSTAQLAQAKALNADNTASEAFTTARVIKPIAETAKAEATTAKNKADKAEADTAKALRDASNAVGEANTAKNKADKAEADAAKALRDASNSIGEATAAKNKAQEAIARIATTEGIARQAQAEAEAALALGGAAISSAANTAQGLSNLAGQVGLVGGTAVNADSKATNALGQISTIKNGVVTNPEVQNAIAIPIGGIKATQEKQQERITQIEQKLSTPGTNTKEVTRAEFEQIKQKLGEADKVNETVNRKTDEILARLPAIPAAVAAAVALRVPSVPQIKQAVGEATCESAQSGCIAGALNNQTNNLKNNFGQGLRDLEQGLNAGANAAQLTLLNTINTKLGAEVIGGITGSLGKFYEWAHIDRALNLLTFAATVHNGMMLSNDIAQTLSQALGNVLTLIGIKDKDGNALNIGSVIGTSIENAIKGVIGAENYAELSANFAKANRIYQATTNILNSFMNLSQTILQASELIASHTGKIGNALKKGGVILENAYGWMNPQPKFNRVTEFLQNFQQTASTIQMVTQAPLDVINATTELTTASTDFLKAVKEDAKPENKATPIPEPDALKAAESQAKSDSQPLSFDFSDLFDGEDL